MINSILQGKEKIIIKTLKPYLKNNRIISIIGTAKNAGKTTVLNQIISEYKNDKIAITSIGLDGEKIDNVTYLEKPRIKLYQGMLFATAEKCLEETDVSFIIHEKTKISTALGKIVIAEVLSEGRVLIAGPSTNTNMKKVITRLQKYNPRKILIDGALFRKSIATTRLVDAIILATGASYSNDINIVVNDTKNIVDQLSLKTIDYVGNVDVRTLKKSSFVNDKTNEIVTIEGSLVATEERIRIYLTNFKYLFLSGALTDRIIDVLIKNRHEFDELNIIVKDGTHVLVSSDKYDKLSKIGVKLYAMNQIDILFITYNPFSPYTENFNDNEFRHKLEETQTFDIINVVTDLE